MIPLEALTWHCAVCGHYGREHDAYEPPYCCGHGMTVDDPDGDCDCMELVLP